MTGPPDAVGSPEPRTSPIRIAAVDDHPIVVEGLISLVARDAPDVIWVGRSGSWADLQQRLREWETLPDLVLYDLHLHDGSRPTEGIASLRGRGITVVILTSEVRPIPIRRAVQAGALGVVLKSDPVDGIVEVIRSAAAGEFAVSSELAFLLITDETLAAQLAPRELEALELLAEGVPRKSIGARMRPPVTLATVVTYLNRVCARYQALGRDVVTPADAVRAAAEDGYLDAPETQRDL